jgi:hypothetical protein
VFVPLDGQVMAEICCEKPVRTSAVSDVERGTLIREAFRLEWFTVAWKVRTVRRNIRYLRHAPNSWPRNYGARLTLKCRCHDGRSARSPPV